MTHHLRVYSHSALNVPLQRLEARLRSENLYAQFKAAGLLGSDWDQLAIQDAGSRELALLSRRETGGGTAGRGQMDRLAAEIRRCRPRSGAEWLARYLKRVKAVYTLQVADPAMGEQGWRVVTELQREIYETAGGVLQEDGTGFTNDLGYCILWQFPEGAGGRWPCAIRRLGQWTAFTMDLGNAGHRKAFLAGRVPPGADLL